MKRRIAAPKERMTYELLKELFRYDPDTGLFWWRARTQSNIRPIEIVAGNVHKQGYIAIHVRGYGYLAHRLAWLYMTEKWPDREIDHIDLNKANNSFGNLREADPKQNCANRPVRADSKSGIKGIIRRNNRWRAVISVDGKRRSLGYFDTPEEAHAVYAAALKAQAGEFARAH